MTNQSLRLTITKHMTKIVGIK